MIHNTAWDPDMEEQSLLWATRDYPLYNKTNLDSLTKLSQKSTFSWQLSQFFPDVLYRNLISFQLCSLQCFLEDLFCLCVSF